MVGMKFNVVFKEPTVMARCTIREVVDASDAKYPAVILMTTNENDGSRLDEWVSLPHDMNAVSTETDFGRLTKAFGGNTDDWIGKQFDKKIERGKERLYPVK